MILTDYRTSPKEELRTNNLLSLLPTSGGTALDIGARDGHYSILLAEYFEKVIALDLTLPVISHPKIECIKGNAESLTFNDESINFIFCAEVLEHIPSNILKNVCSELERVCKEKILIGVPYLQDIRVSKTTCYSCMKTNPPWGHVNVFNENRLISLFPNCTVEKISYVGINNEKTNALSSKLMDLAGNPYGSYDQEEPCIHCGKKLITPPSRNFQKKLLTKLAFWLQKPTLIFANPTANWIHILLSKNHNKTKI